MARSALGILLRLILVEQGKDLPHHNAHRIAQLLRDADEAYTGLAEAADMVFEREMVAREAAEGMDDDDIERVASVVAISSMRCNSGLRSFMPLAPGSMNSRATLQPRAAQKASACRR